MAVFVRRRSVVTIPANSMITRDFTTVLVRNRNVFIFNRGPGRVAVTRSVSADGVNFTILPGATTILPGRLGVITLPSFSVVTRLGISTFARPATIVITWFERLLTDQEE